MTKNRNNARKTQKTVRAPATKFAHLQKRMKTKTLRQTPKRNPFTKTP